VNNAFTSLSFDRRSTIGGINVRFNLSDWWILGMREFEDFHYSVK
jgi:hypothetical protein